MCAIISWSGKLPKGLLTKLLLASETRGRDSTGLAFRSCDDAGVPSNVCWRQVVPARTFASIHPEFMSDARRSQRGIGHTRRASPGMPINNANAHPYTWPYGPQSRYLFAHNGRIENWNDIKDSWMRQYEAELAAAVITAMNALQASGEPAPDANELLDRVEKAIVGQQGADKKRQRIPLSAALRNCPEVTALCNIFARCHHFKSATTDSMVLGPHIESRDFSNLVGCMALVWMRADHVFTYRCAKEAVATNLIWRYKNDPAGEPTGDQAVTVVTSTTDIFMESLSRVADIEADYSFIEIKEGTVYEVTPTGLVDLGVAPAPVGHEDRFTSDRVEDPNTATDSSRVVD